MHAERNAWPTPSLAFSFGLVFNRRWLTTPMDSIGNHTILSVILNSTQGARHLKLNPTALLCQSFLGSYPLGKGVVPAEVPLPGKVRKKDQSSSQRNLVPPGGVWKTLAIPQSKAEVQDINIISLITAKGEYACWFHHICPVLFLVSRKL